MTTSFESGYSGTPLFRALGTLVNINSADISFNEYYIGLLDYYDNWSEMDEEISHYQTVLTHPAESLGHCLVTMATHCYILFEVLPTLDEDASGVVIASAMIEAYLYSVRKAYDAIGSMVAYRVAGRPGQAPSASLHDLIVWGQKNPNRVRPEYREFLESDFSEFYWFRGLRDKIAHQGLSPVAHTDGRQLNLWLHSAQKPAWIAREPLFPVLRRALIDLTRVGNAAAAALKSELGFPDRRHQTRAVSGIYIHYLHRLVAEADQFAKPLPAFPPR